MKNENRRAFEKILYHMNKFEFVPNDVIYELILRICDEYNYASLLKNITDDFVINKNFILNTKNFTKYLQILSVFKETEEYIMNLIDSSFSDFKIPIRAELFEYLILTAILQNNFKKVTNYIELLKKRYKTDYPNEKSRNAEIYRGNIVLINNFYEIIESKNYYKEIGLTKSESDKNFEEKLTVFKTDILEICNELISECKNININWLTDEKFIKIQNYFYLDYGFDFNSIEKLMEEFGKTGFNRKNYLNVTSGELFRKIIGNYIYTKELKDEHAFKNLLDVLNKIINNSDVLINVEDKINLFKTDSIRNLTIFLRNNNNDENRNNIKNLIKKTLDKDLITYLNSNDYEALRKFLVLAFEDYKQVNKFFDDLFQTK